MKKLNNKSWFTLVELLVVITILTIISVVAYQNFGWATDKAVAWRKVNDVATLQSALLQYKSTNNYYPKVWEFNATTNMWWYNTWATITADKSNKIKVTYNWNAIATIDTTSTWGWKIMDNTTPTPKQIWAKWTIWRDTLWRQFLSTDLYDPEVWDLKTTTDDKKFIEKWIWRYVYWIYKNSTWWVWKNLNWTYFNIAYTIKKEWTDDYVTKIEWDYDNTVCSDPTKCPTSLIWTFAWSLKDWETKNQSTSDSADQWVPYAVTDFN